jgi:hypothetical protein
MTRNQAYSYQVANLSEQDEEDYLNLPMTIKFIIKLITYLFLLIVVVKYLTILLGSFASFNGGDVSFTLKHFEKLTLQS